MQWSSIPLVSVLRDRSPRVIYTIFWLLVYCAGIVWSKFLLSVSMWALAAGAFIDIRSGAPGWIRPRAGWPAMVRSLLRDPKYALFIVCFLLVAISGLYSADQADWLTRLRVKVPFLLLPVVFYFLPSFEEERVWEDAGRQAPNARLLFFQGAIIIAYVSMIIIAVKYMYRADEYKAMIYVGQHIPTPVHPIRYSLYLVIAGVMAVELWRSASARWLQVLYALATLGIVAFLHFLAVRSGLAILYVLLCIGLFFWLRKRDLLRWIPVIGLVICGLAYLAYSQLPSLQTKIDYMRWDITQVDSEQVADYSDAKRLISIKAAAQLAQEHPIVGVGLGDLRNELQPIYRESYGVDIRTRPHNQFMTYLAGAGMLGLLLFLLSFYGPLYASKRRSAFLWAIYIATTLSCMVENTLDGAVGTALCLGLILWEIRQLDDRNLNDEKY